MKRLALLTGFLTLAGSLALAQTSTWVPDKAHSEVDFSILHMSLSHVNGHFGNIGGAITCDEADITKSTVNVTIDVTSVDTGVQPKRQRPQKRERFRRCAVPHRHLRQHQRREKWQRPHRQRQSDPSRGHKTRDTRSGGPNRSGSRHGPQAACRILRHHHHQPNGVWRCSQSTRQR